MKNYEDRFWSKVKKGPECWEWIGSSNKRGYGHFSLDNKTESSHRVSYELKKGKIPDGLVIDHLCRNHGCVNPDHLEPVTQKENVRRGQGGKHNSNKTHCKRGHEFNYENTYLVPNGRDCRACRKGAVLKHAMKMRSI